MRRTGRNRVEPVPLYQYKCEGCGVLWEELEKLKDKPLSVCPHCGSGKPERLIGLSNFKLIGDGWAKDGDSK